MSGRRPPWTKRPSRTPSTSSPSPLGTANRGKSWESYLDGLHLGYMDAGAALVTRNYPEVLITSRGEGGQIKGQLRGPGAVDYTVDAAGFSIRFDAKESRTRGGLPFAMLELHQADYLDVCALYGAVPLILLAIQSEEEPTMQAGHVLPWLAIRGRWWRWHMLQQLQRRAKPGEASLSGADVQAASIYSAPVLPTYRDRFDYLSPVVEWADRTRDEREAGRPELRRAIKARKPPYWSP